MSFEAAHAAGLGASRGNARLGERRGSRLALIVAALSGILAILTIVQLAWSVDTIARPDEVMYGEALVFDHAARIAHGEPLYQRPDDASYTIALYTPLYYAVAAAFQSLSRNAFWPGRILSLGAGLVAAGLVARLTARTSGDRRAGAFAALVFLTLAFPGPPPWFALYKEDVLGVALALASIAVLGSAGRDRRLVIAAGLLAGMAFLTKQTFVAAGLAGTVWLWLYARPNAKWFVAAGLLLVLVVGAMLEATTGQFLASMAIAYVDPLALSTLVQNVLTYARFQLGLVVVAGLYGFALVRGDRAPGTMLLVCYWFAAMLPLIGLAKIGAVHNHWMEFAAITAALATLGLWTSLRPGQGRTYRLLPVVLISANVLLVVPRVAESLPALLAEPIVMPADAKAFQALVERVRNEPREVLAGHHVDVVALAGRRILLEPFVAGELYSLGRWNAGPLVERICSGQVGLVVLSMPLESDQWGQLWWPPPVLAALRAAMAFERTQADRYVYVWRQPAAGTACQPATGALRSPAGGGRRKG